MGKEIISTKCEIENELKKGGVSMFKKFAILGLAALMLAGGTIYRSLSKISTVW